MKKAVIAITVTLGLILFWSFYYSDTQGKRLQQGRADFLSSVTSELDEQEVYDIYVFGEDGNISSDYENKINEIFRKYGESIKNLTIMPYSDTAETPYSDYFEMIEGYPTILVFSASGIAFHSESPEQLEDFLSSELAEMQNEQLKANGGAKPTGERIAFVVEIGPTNTEEPKLIEDYDKVSEILETLDGFVDWEGQGAPQVSGREGIQMKVTDSASRKVVIDSYEIFFSSGENEQAYIYDADSDTHRALNGEEEQALQNLIE